MEAAKAGHFTGLPILMPYAKGEWTLYTDFVYTALSGLIVTVPKGFITDLASMPWLVKPLLDGVEDRAAGIVHDWLYCSQQYERDICDSLFKEMLEVLGNNPVKVNLIYAGLRSGSWYYYGKCKGGPKFSDFDWNYLQPYERTLYQSAFKIQN